MTKYRFREVASSVYAWDMHDEGADSVLDNLQNLAHFYLDLLNMIEGTVG